jgi:hypothetical protein
MDEPTIAAPAERGAPSDFERKVDTGPSPALRLLSPTGRVLTNRTAVLAAALAARLRLVRGHAIWPGPEGPIFGIDPGAPRSAAWVEATLEASSRAVPRGLAIRAGRAALGPAAWSGVRAGAFLVGRPPAWLLDLATEVTGRDLSRSRLALFSRSGSSLSKAMCFLFEAGAREPMLLVIAMADPAQSERLRTEYDAVADLRGRLAGDPRTAGALPLEPLFRGAVAGDYIAVAPVDPIASAIGNEERAAALDWLLRFQTLTRSTAQPWGAEDDELLIGPVVDAWGALRPGTVTVVRERLGDLLRGLRGTTAWRCAVHGDFWHGNLAVDAGEVRVYDWEWAASDALPFLDLWTYEFGVLLRPPIGGPPAGGLEAAVERVSDSLAARDLDRAFAHATLAPSLAELAIRMRRITGRPGPAETALQELMADAERVLSHRGGAARG